MTRLRLAALAERARGSLFFLPMVCIVGGVVLGEANVTVDRWLTEDGTDLPFRLTSTVDSARAILTTVAAATITFAAIAFSIVLLIFQMASSQYSPRVIHGLFREPLNKRVMGAVVGTFAYCLVVLRTVRGPVEEGGEPVVPSVSVGVAVLLGIGTVMAIVKFIDHAAHRIDVSEILQSITRDTLGRLPHLDDDPHVRSMEVPEEPGFVVRFDDNGWIQQMDHRALLRVAEPDGVVRADSIAGRYAFAGTPLCTVWPPPERAREGEVVRRARGAVDLGNTRTMQQDVSYGLRQMVDVALKGLSAGINDPTTAQDAIFHATAVLAGLLRQPTTRLVTDDDGRRLLLPEAPQADDLIAMTYDEVRLAAADKPTVAIYLLEAMDMLTQVLLSDGLAHLAPAVEAQAALVVSAVEKHAGLPPHDVERVRAAHAARFSSAESG